MPAPETPQAGEAQVRVRHVGICGTDWHAIAGRQPFFTYPRILGHELGVEVEAVGEDVTNVKVGDRCAVEPYLARAGDPAFARGKTNCGLHTQCLGVHTDGGMVERLTLPAHLLHPADLPTRALALVETLCIGRHAAMRPHLQGDEIAAIIGLGPIGLASAQFARLRGLAPVLIDMSEARLTQAAKLMPGVPTLHLPPDKKLPEIWDATYADRPEVIWDCTGHAGSMETSLTLAGHGGHVCFVGLVQADISFNDPAFHRRELTLYASRNAVAKDFAAVIEAVKSGRVDVEAWITHESPAEDFPALLENWRAPDSGLLKSVLAF